MRRCLITSPHFPPSTVAGVHRARHLAKHLPAHGWAPPDLRIIETGALPLRLEVDKQDEKWLAAYAAAQIERERSKDKRNLR